METLKEEWKEWSSLRTLMDKIPQQFQQGLSVSPLSLTCIDAYPDHLILGTNAGLVYLTHLPSHNIIKLKCENSYAPISCIDAISSVDDMIAVGDCKGGIIIFQIPSVSANNLTASQGNSMMSNQYEPRSLKRFILKLHKSSVTSLVWSRNCAKLFSGDMEGNICIVDVDYAKSECTGRTMFQVDSRVIQLSYSHQLLAISYKERCLIYNLKDNTKRFVGSKPRNPPGLYGCAFGTTSEELQENVLYCSRPGPKIWVSDSEGVVLYSYIQQKLPDHSQIQLIGIPKSSHANMRYSFGYLHHYKDSVIISHSENCLIILNVKDQRVLGYSYSFHRICDIAVDGDKVFILENNRNVVCISPKDPRFTINPVINPLVNSVHLPLKDSLNLSALNGIKSKMLPNKEILNNISKIGETFASKLSEITTPSIIPGNIVASEEKGLFDNQSTKEDLENQKQQSCNYGVYRPKPYFFGAVTSARVEDAQKYNNETKVASGHTQSSSEGSNSTSSSPLEASLQENQVKTGRRDEVVLPPRTKKKVRKKKDLKTLETEAERNNPILFNDDSRTYDDFKQQIEEKESLLADVLNLSCLRMDHDKPQVEAILSKSFDLQEQDLEYFPFEGELHRHLSTHSVKFMDGQGFLERKDANHLNVGYGPPSGSSAINSLSEDCYNQSADNGQVVSGKLSDAAFLIVEEFLSSSLSTMPPPVEMPLGWKKNHLPAAPNAILGYGNSICIVELRDLYFSNDFFIPNEKLPSWIRRRLSVEISSFCSFGEDLVLRLKRGPILSLGREKLVGSSHQNVCKLLEDNENIVCAAFDRNILWLLYKSGKVIGQNFNEGEQSVVRVSCQELTLKSLVCRAGVVWGLTDKGRIAYRIGVRPSVPLGLEWGILLHPQEVISIHLSENGLGWMMDANGNLYLSLYVSQTYPQGLDGKWWQVGLSDYMFDEPLPSELGAADDKAPRVMMTSNDDYLWVVQIGCPYAFTHSIKSFVGHRWERLIEEPLICICAGGVFQSYGILYCLDATGDLFAVSPYSDRVVPIDLPGREKLISISARPESLWVLTKSGKIFIRSGLSGKTVLGVKWIRLGLQQIDDVQLKSLSLSTEVVWAVDSTGLVYLRQGPLIPPDPKRKGLDPAWLQVDTKELKNGAVFEKVYVGNKNHLVWGIDSSHRVYVREAIYPEFPTGTSWVLVPGILAQSLSISENRVFVVTVSGEGKSKIYEREGISSTNYIGESWRRIPSHSLNLKDISVSVDNCLWALDEAGKLYKHSTLSLFDVNLDGELPEESRGHNYSSSDMEDWEVV